VDISPNYADGSSEKWREMDSVVLVREEVEYCPLRERGEDEKGKRRMKVDK